MPNISKIEGLTPKIGSYKNDTSDFLKEEEINTTAEKLNHDDALETIYNDIKGQIDHGLSTEALLIEGRAPLYELTTELLNHLTATKEDYDLVGEKQIKPLGNKHRYDEVVDNYFPKVQKEYSKCLKKLQTVIEAYNDSDLKYVKGYDEEDECPVYGYYRKIDVSIDPVILDKPPLIPIIPTAKDDKNPDAHNYYMDMIESAAKEAQDFYEDPYTPAKNLDEECLSLDTSFTEIDVDSYDISSENGTDAENGSGTGDKKADFEIDEKHKKLSEEEKKGKNCTHHTTDDSYVVKEVREDGSIVYYRYNKNGDLTEVHVVTDDGDEYYTKDGVRGTKVEGGSNPRGNPVVPGENAKAKGYDDNTAVVTVKNEDGSKSYYRYDKNGDLIEIEENGTHYFVNDGKKYEFDKPKDENGEYPENKKYEIKDEDGNKIADYWSNGSYSLSNE